MTGEQRKALDAFVAVVRAHYGDRLVDIVVFGSRARGDAHEDSDLDLAVILGDPDWHFWTEKRRLAELAYDALLEADLYIQTWPIGLADWQDPARHSNPALIRAMKRDARDLRDAA